MCQKYILLIASLIGYFVTFAQPKEEAMRGLPSVEEVAKKFYNAYYTDGGDEYGFEKRADRWMVAVKEWKAPRLVATASFLYFDADSGGYQHLPLPEKTDTTPVDFRKHIGNYDLLNYRVHAYYGYDGWYKDVIGYLGGRASLPDSALNSLARAYSEYASCMLHDQENDGLKADLLDLPLARNCMIPAQRAQYHQVESKAIETFARLARLNPNFETIVGKAPIKYANEVMVEFHAYMTYADSFAVTFPLPDSLYPDSIAEKSRHVLEKCPRDAILLSLGDNDFYPILYFQQHYHLRTDVRLINYNLIGIDRFIYMATQSQFESQRVRLSVMPHDYEGTNNNFLFLKDRATAMPFSEVLDTLQKGQLDENGARTLPGKEFVLRRGSGNNTVHFRETTYYIPKNDWVLLDILNNLRGRRIACETPLADSLTPLNAYFAQVDDDLWVY